MPFLFGSTKVEAARPPKDTEALRKDLASFLQEQMGTLAPQDPKAFELSPFFIEQFLDPTREMFTERRRGALAQGLESVGNLTGSGVSERLGGVVNRSLGQEEFLLSQILRGEFGRQFAGREGQRQRIAQLMGGFSTAGVGAPQVFRQQGLLDSLFGGLAAGAPFFAELLQDDRRRGYGTGGFQTPSTGGTEGQFGGGNF